MPVGDKEFCVIDCQAELVIVAKKVDDSLRNAFGEQRDVLNIEVARFERNFDNENLFNLGTLSDSREGARSNPVYEVKM